VTRPVTLSEAADRVRDGAPREVALAEFLDSFYSATQQAEQLAMLDAEPRMSGDARLDALLGAVAEYLAKQHRLPRVPAWVGGAGRVLAEPWFTSVDNSDGMREYLALMSPAEFVHHNIFTEPQPLRRARLRPSQQAKP
jgi:hypothetical protein